ncbi:hypothetical protein KAFR_0J02270 [Kazachstania africana CBS 2517]|uniref:Small ribosomal subunit protein uS4m n=1 Tax=Kazachstania africana (strain ATCC 22294 / BCRC 22015 / CBS 2517 / CECT 1963 / NBRC 1671 / NRRL Y-8276) TaxID=1071382 RepID=H2B0Z1_KAZAF|nr:hypothetical protein KAFR_0J02270 [Kazachstania africana CBS 2517]CCF60291.1 hypothetical protein KAFR_0J02270 [Kazachstania africana CBS 2517]
MPKKAILLKSLTRGRIRASFNKYNLFNLYKKGQIDFKTKTLYQQKWLAKQETRAYHGEFLTEGRWNAIFDSKLDSVAQLDASLRGDQEKIKETPYLLQTFAALEKRLDFALFRAMFASSVRQARQFILHGNVTVNNIRIRHPGYILKPGDIFHVKPDKVLEALGAKKPSLNEAIKVDKTQITLWNRYVKKVKTSPRRVWEDKMAKYRSLPDSSIKKQSFLTMIKDFNRNLDKKLHDELRECTPINLLTEILTVVKDTPNDNYILSADDFKTVVDRNVGLSSKAFACYSDLAKSNVISRPLLQDQDMNKLAKSLMSFTPELKQLSDGAKISIRLGIKKLSELSKEYSESIRNHYENTKIDTNSHNIPFHEDWHKNLRYHDKVDFEKIKENEKVAETSIKLPWQNHAYGRQLPTKPYFTPWKPRQFLAPFAILPHHIEVSFKTCHGIYLRDPVARPGHSDVISPFGSNIHERAYMFYVKRGK